MPRSQTPVTSSAETETTTPDATDTLSNIKVQQDNLFALEEYPQVMTDRNHRLPSRRTEDDLHATPTLTLYIYILRDLLLSFNCGWEIAAKAYLTRDIEISPKFALSIGHSVDRCNRAERCHQVSTRCESVRMTFSMQLSKQHDYLQK